MCGISGIIQFNEKPIREEEIRLMMQKMKHRGPDDEGLFIENIVGLGFVRLSILDLSPAGHQPMLSNNERYVIVFNGEIFNYIELREKLKTLGHNFNTGTDTEVILAAWQQWGEDCQNHFNGMWAFVIYDREEKKIFISRDRFGIKPFYYYFDQNRFAFASEIPPLLSIMPEKAEPNKQAIFDYLVFNRTDQTESTFFKKIKKLQHGQCISIDILKMPQIALNIKPWYNLKESVLKAEAFKDSDEFLEFFSKAVNLRLRSDVPVGVSLSGGLDSSAIVSIILEKNKKEDLNTFSAIYKDGQRGDEKLFINLYKTQLKNMFFTNPDSKSLLADIDAFIGVHAEPLPSTGPYAQYKVMDLAKGNVVVTLDGQGADEMLAGYHYFFGFYFKDLFLKRKLGLLLKEITHYTIKHRSLYGLKTLVYFWLPKKLKTKARVSKISYLDANFTAKYNEGNQISGNLYESRTLKDALLNHFEYKLEHLLKWSDRNSMKFSIESRPPFLDHELVERTLSINNEDIIKAGNTKYLLRQAMKGILPEQIRLRQDKIGFATPEDEWFREPAFQDLINGILDSESFKSREIINPSKAKLQYQKHLNKEINISKDIWKWINLELWLRKFIDIPKS